MCIIDPVCYDLAGCKHELDSTVRRPARCAVQAKCDDVEGTGVWLHPGSATFFRAPILDCRAPALI
jgi:hypothetical protein